MATGIGQGIAAAKGRRRTAARVPPIGGGSKKASRKRKGKKGGKKRRAKKAGKRKGKKRARKVFSTKVQVGRKNRRVRTPVGDTLKVSASARKIPGTNRKRVKVTVYKIHHGRVVKHEK